LRWLSNVEVRTRADYVNREYVNWWLLYHFLITCVPFTTIVVGRFAHFAMGAGPELCRPAAPAMEPAGGGVGLNRRSGFID
jgi:hypothetical protein